MRQIITATLAGLILSMPFAMTLVYAAPVPCEDMLQDLRSAAADAKLSDADIAKVAELEAKGVERCNADDDRRADDFFAQAIKILGN